MFASTVRAVNTALFLYMVSLFVMEGRKCTFQNCVIALFSGLALLWVIRALTCLVLLTLTSFVSYVILRPRAAMQ